MSTKQEQSNNRVMSKLYDTGKHKWEHGTIVEWHSNRAAARWLLGPCPACGSVTSNYGGAFSCHNDYCQNSASMFVCSPEPTPDWWNTDIDVKLDGDAWCATGSGFVNLQESPAGFGKCPREAVEELRKAISLEEASFHLFPQNETMRLLEWVYNNGEGREVWPTDLCGDPDPNFEALKRLLTRTTP